MDHLEKLIDSEFSVFVIGDLNLKLDKISALISEKMDSSAYHAVEDEIYTELVNTSKDFFTQGFLRGIAVAKGSRE